MIIDSEDQRALMLKIINTVQMTGTVLEIKQALVEVDKLISAVTSASIKIYEPLVAPEDLRGPLKLKEANVRCRATGRKRKRAKSKKATA